MSFSHSNVKYYLEIKVDIWKGVLALLCHYHYISWLNGLKTKILSSIAIISGTIYRPAKLVVMTGLLIVQATSPAPAHSACNHKLYLEKNQSLRDEPDRLERGMPQISHHWHKTVLLLLLTVRERWSNHQHTVYSCSNTYTHTMSSRTLHTCAGRESNLWSPPLLLCWVLRRVWLVHPLGTRSEGSHVDQKHLYRQNHDHHTIMSHVQDYLKTLIMKWLSLQYKDTKGLTSAEK